MSLRKKVIRLAHQKPELREHLLPLIKEANMDTSISNMIKELIFRAEPSGLVIKFSTKGYQVSSSTIRMPILDKEDKYKDLYVFYYVTKGSLIISGFNVSANEKTEVILNLHKEPYQSAIKKINSFFKSF